MRNTLAFALLLALAAVVASPRARVEAQSGQDLSARWNGFLAAVKSKDAAKVASFYSTDALLLDQGRSVLKGRAAIEQSMAKGLQGSLSQIVTTVLDTSSAGDIGYVVGTFTQPTSTGGSNAGRSF